MRILVFGASGMVGSAMVRVLGDNTDWQVYGTLRGPGGKSFFRPALADRMLVNVDVEKPDVLARVFAQVRPDVVVNCVGLTKHQQDAADPLLAIPLNALLPHRLADLCAVVGARMVHVSTDCVFSGLRGSYREQDPPDATDLYGKSKYLGEVSYPHALTIRTSPIGHELQSAYGLLEWFLARDGHCKGYTRAIFSGLTNTEFARVVRDVVIPRPDLAGLYHLGAQPINKFDLLQLIARVYGKTIDISADPDFVVDRSLDSTRFSAATGYVAPIWPTMIEAMCADHHTPD